MEKIRPLSTVDVSERALGGADALTTIAEDRLEGAEAIGRFIDPNLTLREVRRLLEQGHYPCWREGRVYVASKSAMLAHWRAMTAPQTQVNQAHPLPRNKSVRRGYLGLKEHRCRGGRS